MYQRVFDSTINNKSGLELLYYCCSLGREMLLILLLLLLLVASQRIFQIPLSQHSQASDTKPIKARHNKLPHPQTAAAVLRSSRAFELLPFSRHLSSFSPGLRHFLFAEGASRRRE